MIVSDELWLPWELIKPRFADGQEVVVEDDFLCADYRLARWVSGPPMPSLFGATESALIPPRRDGSAD